MVDECSIDGSNADVYIAGMKNYVIGLIVLLIALAAFGPVVVAALMAIVLMGLFFIAQTAR
jgi:hypothetical protein